MRERDDSFVASLAIALAAHALLFLLLWTLVPAGIAVKRPVDLIDIQVGGTGGDGRERGGGEAGSGPAAAARAQGGPPKQARAAVPARTPTKAAVKAAPAVAPVQPAPAVTPTAAPPSQPQENPSPAAESSNGTGSTRGSGQQEATGTGATVGGSGTGSSGGTGSGGTGGGSGAGTVDAGGPAEVSPVATIADIDPVPIREITAAYPTSAKRLGQEGLVKIQADVDTSGAVVASRVTRSSGFASLDNAALDAVKNARFLPALKNGRTVEASIIIPIRFRLKD
ncbi:MAG: TonB family protein [Spirochaetia bacterium]|jgi:protein TonB